MDKGVLPPGMRCPHCDEDILADDSGFIVPSIAPGGEPATAYYHEECFVRQVVGSVGHQQHRCSCHGGSEEDPPGMTARQAAHAAMVELSLRLGDAQF